MADPVLKPAMEMDTTHWMKIADLIVDGAFRNASDSMVKSLRMGLQGIEFYGNAREALQILGRVK